jgi:hypothetical protein
MTPTRTIVLVLAGALLALAGMTLVVHYGWLHWEIAMWIGMLVIFLAGRGVQAALQGRGDASRRRR